MGCYGHVTSLRRISSGSFDLSMAAELDDIIKLSKSPGLNNLLYPLELGLTSMKQGTCTSSEAEKIKNGNSSPIFCEDAKCGEEIWVSYRETPLAIGKYEAGVFLPKKVLNLTKSELNDNQGISER